MKAFAENIFPWLNHAAPVFGQCAKLESHHAAALAHPIPAWVFAQALSLHLKHAALVTLTAGQAPGELTLMLKDEIRQAAAFCLLAGVSSNPPTVAKHDCCSTPHA